MQPLSPKGTLSKTDSWPYRRKVSSSLDCLRGMSFPFSHSAEISILLLLSTTYHLALQLRRSPLTFLLPTANVQRTARRKSSRNTLTSDSNEDALSCALCLLTYNPFIFHASSVFNFVHCPAAILHRVYRYLMTLQCILPATPTLWVYLEGSPLASCLCTPVFVCTCLRNS